MAHEQPNIAPLGGFGCHTILTIRTCCGVTLLQVWLADDLDLVPVYERCRALLPSELSGGVLAGLNARWRLYRYGQDAVYRPHVDGAWPGSGIKEGVLEYDAYGDRWSRLTFIIYLNDDFEGGAPPSSPRRRTRAAWTREE